MNNNVILAIDSVMRGLGVSTMRFDFRGSNSGSRLYECPRGAIEDASLVIKHIANKMGIRDFAIIGYSFGGSIALRVSMYHLPSLLITVSASWEILKDSGVPLDNLSMISCPSLLIHGRADRMVPFLDMTRISTHLGGSVDLFAIDSEGHFFLKSLSIVLDTVLTFMKNSWDMHLQDD